MGSARSTRSCAEATGSGADCGAGTPPGAVRAELTGSRAASAAGTWLGAVGAAPPDVPPLEDSAKGKNKNLTLREILAIHAEQKVCASCHVRMDPIGLALENYNAIGVWRDTEKGRPIDASGELMTGEKFTNARELSTILATVRKEDFHRAVAEKLMTYAVGRGIEYFDAPTIDKIVADAEKKGGSLLEILYGVTESAPFQKRRGDGGM